MSEPSRAERRRNARGGATPPPAKRDPMIPIYIGFGVIIVLVFIGFGISNFISNRARAQAIAFDYGTPSPGPQPTTKPIQLKDPLPQAVGKPIFGLATPDPKKGILSDTPMGGHGQSVDGIPCETNEAVAVHVHSQLAILVDGAPLQVPPYIGIALTPTSQTGSCLYWIHTHDASGVIHVEAGEPGAPNGGPYTLGMFFDIWGQPLTRSQVGPFKGNVTSYVNGQPYSGSLADIPLRSHQRIVLEVGQPVVPPPTYLLPKGD